MSAALMGEVILFFATSIAVLKYLICLTIIQNPIDLLISALKCKASERQRL